MPVATFKVRPDPQGSSNRPSKERIDRAASALEAHGLKVLHQGRFGVSVDAPAECLTEIAGVVVPNNAPVVAKVHPPDKTLADLLESVEVKPQPQLY